MSGNSKEFRNLKLLPLVGADQYKAQPLLETSTTPLASIIPIESMEPTGEILYINEPVIKQIADKIMAAAYLNQELERQIFSTKDRQNSYKQILKVWNRAGDVNWYHLVLYLSDIMPLKKEAGELVKQIKMDKSNCRDIPSIHAGMPVRVCGVLHSKQDVQRSFIRLYGRGVNRNVGVRLTMAKDNDLNRNYLSLSSRMLFALGIIGSLGRALTIQTGAVLMGTIVKNHTRR